MTTGRSGGCGDGGAGPGSGAGGVGAGPGNGSGVGFGNGSGEGSGPGPGIGSGSGTGIGGSGGGSGIGSGAGVGVGGVGGGVTGWLMLRSFRGPVGSGPTVSRRYALVADNSGARLRAVASERSRRRPDVARGGADELAALGLLQNVGAPADRPAHGEGRGEHRTWDAAGVHHHTGVELDIGIPGVVGMCLAQRVDDGLLGADRCVDSRSAEALRDLAQQQRSGILGAVDGVPEPHDPTTLSHLLTGPLEGIAVRDDLVEGIKRTVRGLSLIHI